MLHVLCINCVCSLYCGILTTAGRRHHRRVWQVEAKTVKAAQRKEARKRRAKDAREKPWRDKEKAAPAFSFTDYVKYQDAIKAVLKRRKWKRKLAQGKNPPLPVI